MKSYLIILCILIFSFSFSQTTCEKASDMVATIEKFHYDAKPIDSSFSELFSDVLLDKADAYGLFLSSEDVSILRAASYQLKGDLENENCTFFTKFSEKIESGIVESRERLSIMNNRKFSEIENDSITIEKGKYFVPKSQIDRRWNKWLQYLLKNSLDDNDFTTKQIDSIYQTVLALEQCRIDSYFTNNSLDSKISEWYLTSLANTFDPHTNYFSNDSKESFYGSLSDENFSFGFALARNERGQLEVASIVPGGAAWKSNRINEGAILNTVIANEKVKDFSCIRYSEAMNFLNSSEVESAKFLFETERGILDTISLKKTLITVQENIVQSFILKDSTHTTGYIYLPSFYTSDNEFGISTNGCSADISREILRLKKEGIEALIIDLRGNGGGHMIEAINLIGIFINYGTLGIIDGDEEKSSLIKDMNKGLIYDGPLTIMIDEFSASASEFFAVTLQDYNRALIVGSTSYGKSTAQTVLPIEAHRYLSPGLMDFEPKHFVKLTVNRFYRVNGDTYQRQGVKPDIVFPSFLDDLETGEKAAPSAILPNHIERKTYFKTPYSLARDEVKEMFDLRNANNSYFDIVNNVSKLYAQYWRSNTYLIGLNSKNQKQEAYYSSLNDYYSHSAEPTFNVSNPAYLSGYSDQINSEKEINASVMENIINDQGIIETFLITIDLINTKNN